MGNPTEVMRLTTQAMDALREKARDTLNKGGLCRSFGSWAGILVCEASLARTTDGFAL